MKADRASLTSALQRLGRAGWRWQIAHDPGREKHRQYVCSLSRGAGPPPYGQWAHGNAGTMNLAMARALRDLREMGYSRAPPKALEGEKP